MIAQGLGGEGNHERRFFKRKRGQLVVSSWKPVVNGETMGSILYLPEEL